MAHPPALASPPCSECGTNALAGRYQRPVRHPPRHTRKSGLSALPSAPKPTRRNIHTRPATAGCRAFHENHIVRQHDGKWLVAHQFFRPHAPHVPNRALLFASRRKRRSCRKSRAPWKQLGFTLRFEQLLQLEANVEMVFDGRFSASGDDDNVLYPGMHRFFYTVLNQWLIDNREHLLRLRFGRRQESGTQPGGGKYSFSNLWII